MLLVSWYRFVTVDKSSFIGSWYRAVLQYDSNYLVHSSITVDIFFCCITTGRREWWQTFIPFIHFLLELLLVNWSVKTWKTIRERRFPTERKDNCSMLTCTDKPLSCSLICSAKGSSFVLWKMGGKSYFSTRLGFNDNNRIWGTGCMLGPFFLLVIIFTLKIIFLDICTNSLPIHILVYLCLLGFLIFYAHYNSRCKVFTKIVSICIVAQVMIRIQSATTCLEET